MYEIFNPSLIGFARTHALAAVSREHFPPHRLALTRGAFDFLVAHAENDDLADLWHHVLLMAHIRQVRLFAGGHTFQIARGRRRQPRWHLLQIQFHGSPFGEPCATVMLPNEA